MVEPPSSTLAVATSHVSIIPKSISHPLPLNTETGSQAIILSCHCDPNPFGGPLIPNTDHICVNLAYFSSYFKIRPTYIRLPNWATVTGSYCGTINFTASLTLTNVFFVLNFTYNLLSTSQLTLASKCSILFLPDRCYM